MLKYDGMFESILKLQEAYDKPIGEISGPIKEKDIFCMKKLPYITPKHHKTNKSFEDTKRILKELDNSSICELIETHEIKQQVQSEHTLVKRLTLPSNRK